MIKEINVIKCPYCGDTWESNSDIPKECHCFRCKHNYIPDKIYKMDDFVFNAIHTVKGN